MRRAALLLLATDTHQLFMPGFQLSFGVLWSIVAAFVAMHLVYWTDTRMRAPVMPLLAILSAIGWTAIVPRWNRPLSESQ